MKKIILPMLLVSIGLVAAAYLGGSYLVKYINKNKPDKYKIEAAKILAKNVEKIKDGKIKRKIKEFARELRSRL